jgi:hypothetical protein
MEAARVSEFVPGLQLSRDLYERRVRPALDARLPRLPHSAALLGRGSEVLGFDDEMSSDHDWRPRVLLFLTADDLARHGDEVEQVLRRELAAGFRGRPADAALHTVRGFFLERLALDIDDEIAARDWLTLPEHGLRMCTAGAVFHDEVGLTGVRDRLAHYPRDVWLYLMMAGWWRIHPEANLVGRAGFVGDELGSAVLGSGLVSDLMRLCFLMEREYAPYSKWFGTAFSRLGCGPELTPLLWRVLRAGTWADREQALLAAYDAVTAVHNALGLTEPAVTRVVQMWDRPFRVAWADVPELLHAEISDPEVLRIAERWPVGPVDRLRDQLWPAAERTSLLRLFDAGS